MHCRAAMVLISLNVRGRDSTRNYKGGRKGEMIQYAGNIGSQSAEWTLLGSFSFGVQSIQ